MASVVPRKPNWTEQERYLSCKIITDKLDELSAKFSGASPCKQKKSDIWQAVANEINSSGVGQCNRSVDQIKNMWKNVKARGKAKTSLMKKTGGGPAPVFTLAEMEAMVKLADHPEIAGVPGGSDNGDGLPTLQISNAAKSCDTDKSIVSEVCPTMEPEQKDAADANNIDALTPKQPEKVCPTVESAPRSAVKRRKQNREGDRLLDLEIQRAALEVQLLQQKVNQGAALFELNKQSIQNAIQQDNNIFELKQELLKKNLTDAYQQGFLNIES